MSNVAQADSGALLQNIYGAVSSSSSIRLPKLPAFICLAANHDGPPVSFNETASSGTVYANSICTWHRLIRSKSNSVVHQLVTFTHWFVLKMALPLHPHTCFSTHNLDSADPKFQ